MFSVWDLVHPRVWYPMSSMETSIMDMDRMADEMLRSNFPFTRTLLSIPTDIEDDGFFKDLPMSAKNEEMDLETKQTPNDSVCQRAFSSYSYNSSSVIDDAGRRIESTRRRYEDSNGRLKATHVRKIGNKVLRKTWNRPRKQDDGDHAQTLTEGTVDEFEKEWNETPFGKAAKKKEEAIKAGSDKEPIEEKAEPMKP